jgi:hypothetical protein
MPSHFWEEPFLKSISMNAILFSLLAFLSNGDVPAVSSQDRVLEEQKSAETWAMHIISVIQAEAGDIQGAKRTASQITEDDLGKKAPSDVTVVSFCNGCPIYSRRTETDPRLASIQYEVFSYDPDRTSDSVPVKVPAGLPSNYLEKDPQHGEVIDFVDSRDINGKRVTSRRYADGSVVIETP